MTRVAQPYGWLTTRKAACRPLPWPANRGRPPAPPHAIDRGPPLPGVHAGGPRRPPGLDRSGGVAKGKRRPPAQSLLRVARQLAHNDAEPEVAREKSPDVWGPADHGQGRRPARMRDNLGGSCPLEWHALPPPTNCLIAPRMCPEHVPHKRLSVGGGAASRPPIHCHSSCTGAAPTWSPAVRQGPCVSFGWGPSLQATFAWALSSSERACCWGDVVGGGGREFSNEGPRCVAGSLRRCVCSRSAAAGPARVLLQNGAVTPSTAPRSGGHGVTSGQMCHRRRRRHRRRGSTPHSHRRQARAKRNDDRVVASMSETAARDCPANRRRGQRGPSAASPSQASDPLTPPAPPPSSAQRSSLSLANLHCGGSPALPWGPLCCRPSGVLGTREQLGFSRGAPSERRSCARRGPREPRPPPAVERRAPPPRRPGLVSQAGGGGRGAAQRTESGPSPAALTGGSLAESPVPHRRRARRASSPPPPTSLGDALPRPPAAAVPTHPRAFPARLPRISWVFPSLFSATVGGRHRVCWPSCAAVGSWRGCTPLPSSLPTRGPLDRQRLV